MMQSSAPLILAPAPAPSLQPRLTVTPRKIMAVASRISQHAQLMVPSVVPLSASSTTYLTHYGESYNGQVLGCGGGYYSSDNATIVAVGPGRASAWPCGTMLQICGPVSCALAVRQDSCPGCSPYVLDLSEAGIGQVCGAGTEVCKATVNAVTLCYHPADITSPDDADAVTSTAQAASPAGSPGRNASSCLTAPEPY